MLPWAVVMGSARVVGLDWFRDKGRGHSSVRAPMKKEEEEAGANPVKGIFRARRSEDRVGINTKCEPMAEVGVAEEFPADWSIMVGEGQRIADGSDNGWLLVGQWKSRWFDCRPAVRPDQHQMRSYVTVRYPKGPQYRSQHIPLAQLESAITD